MLTIETKQPTNPHFGALNKIRYGKASIPNSYWEIRVTDELKKLAGKNDFFKKNDVNATINTARGIGTKVTLSYKPNPRNILEQIKNLFIKPKEYVLHDTSHCPDDSSYFVAKKLRDFRYSKGEFPPKQ